jgi:threonine dehydrogenase-like Zn-dependent dehydrogenase
VPHAATGLVKLPDGISDDQAILMSDIFPTGWFGMQLAEVTRGDTVAVFGCGPVGQFAIASCLLRGAGRVFAVDHLPSRLEMAAMQGAEPIDFDHEDPVDAILRLTGGIGVVRAIDAVGVDAQRPHHGPAGEKAAAQAAQYDEELRELAAQARPQGALWQPGDGPSQAIRWAVDALAKAGTLGVIGVYPQNDRFFPIGAAMNRNLSINLGNCNHRAILPTLVELVGSGIFDPSRVLTQSQPLMSAIDAYKAFDQREPGWIKVKLEPSAMHAANEAQTQPRRAHDR